MPGVYKLTFRDGREEQLWGHDGYYYVLSGDRLLSFQTNPVWCHTCKAITLGETHASKLEIEEELRQMDDPNSQWYQNQRRPPTPRDIAFWKEHLNDLLLLWQERTSLPKCLTCFQPTVSNFVWNKWAPHPGTGEEVQYRCIGVSSTNLAQRFFTPNCDELSLSADEKSALWERVRRGDIL